MLNPPPERHGAHGTVSSPSECSLLGIGIVIGCHFRVRNGGGNLAVRDGAQ